MPILIQHFPTPRQAKSSSYLILTQTTVEVPRVLESRAYAIELVFLASNLELQNGAHRITLQQLAYLSRKL